MPATRARAAVALSAAFAAIWFAPALRAPFADGDRLLAQLGFLGKFAHVSQADVYREIAARYGSLHPGWFPLAPLPLAIWTLDSRFAFAAALNYALVITSFALFAWLVTRVLGTWAAVLAVVLTVAAWQFRFPHDPVVGTMLVWPWSSALLFLTLGLWLQFEHDRRAATFGACAVTLIATTFAGEVNLVVAGLLAVGATVRGRKPTDVALLAIVLVCGAIAFVHGPFPGPWSHAGGYLRDVAAQAIAALPSTYRGFGHLAIGRVPALYTHTALGWRFINNRYTTIAAISSIGWTAVLFAGGLALLAMLRLPETATTGGRYRRAAAIATVLWLAPALVLGAPGVWQHGVPFGQALDAVYVQYFGVGLLGATLLNALMTRPSSRAVVPAIVALGVLLIAYGNVRADATVVARNAHRDRGRAALQLAGSVGFFNVLPPRAKLVIGPKSLAMLGLSHSVQAARLALFGYAHRRFSLTSLASARSGRGGWLLQVHPNALIPIRLAHWASGPASHPTTDRAFGYTNSAVAVGQAAWQRRRASVETRVTPLSTGDSIAVRQRCGPVPANAPLAAPRPHLHWFSGAYPQGPVGYDPGRPTLSALGDVTTYAKMYLESHAMLKVVPSICRSRAVVLDGVLLAGADATLTARGAGRSYSVALSTALQTISWSFPTRGNRPFRITFRTTAPKAVFYPQLFRYERSFPHATRVMLELAPVYELSPATRHAGGRKP